MTVQIAAPFKHGKSKATLQDALNSDLEIVNFREPSPFGDRIFGKDSIKPGESFPVVLDPATRRRFAKVPRTATNIFKVS